MSVDGLTAIVGLSIIFAAPILLLAVLIQERVRRR